MLSWYLILKKKLVKRRKITKYVELAFASFTTLGLEGVIGLISKIV